MLYAARCPEEVAAYVGSGQYGDWPAAESSSYAFAVAEALRLNNRKALKALRAIGRPESSIFDLPNIWRGWRFSLDAM